MYDNDLPEPRYRGRPSSIKTLEKLGQEQLSRHSFMCNFLYSEIGAFAGIPNVPDDPELAVRAGRAARHDQVPRLADPTLDRLHLQARLQTDRAEKGPQHVLRPAVEGQGFDLLPKLTDGDLF